ncbi:hypothetical protein QBC37DRAFT_394915 [Rhypophila decipiens]|uniref:Uncharacterized protein n=1 Tax=Rhypophila decipiens TaxID=261697 RepID=A0AAN6YK04_9PEZI|nr:hypothetical protein QBC37DRAFT_394915 [Rhypophila decipiens]
MVFDASSLKSVPEDHQMLSILPDETADRHRRSSRITTATIPIVWRLFGPRCRDESKKFYITSATMSTPYPNRFYCPGRPRKLPSYLGEAPAIMTLCNKKKNDQAASLRARNCHEENHKTVKQAKYLFENPIGALEKDVDSDLIVSHSSQENTRNPKRRKNKRDDERQTDGQRGKKRESLPAHDTDELEDETRKGRGELRVETAAVRTTQFMFLPPATGMACICPRQCFSSHIRVTVLDYDEEVVYLRIHQVGYELGGGESIDEGVGVEDRKEASLAPSESSESRWFAPSMSGSTVSLDIRCTQPWPSRGTVKDQTKTDVKRASPSNYSGF